MANLLPSLENLYGLYYAINKGSEFVTLNDFRDFKIIFTKDSVWPNIVFDINETRFSQQVLQEISKQSVLLGIRPAILGAFSTDFIKIFRSEYYLPIDQWISMNKNLGMELHGRNSIEGVDCSVVSPDSDLVEWIKIVNDSLFSSKHLNPDVFLRLMGKVNVIFVSAILKGECVGTALVYQNSPESAGLYMVCVKDNKRGLGIGSAIIDFVFSQLTERGISKCFLQSTNVGLSLYEKMGFEKGEPITLYWKVK